MEGGYKNMLNSTLNMAEYGKYWKDYLQYGKRLYYKKKSIIFSENSPANQGFYYLENGFVKISTKTFVGGERTIVIAEEGGSFGEQAVDGLPYFSTATAIDNCIIYFFSFDEIKAQMGTDHSLRMLVYHSLTDKLRLLVNNSVLCSLPSEQLLARSILQMKVIYAGDEIPLTQQELCCFTGLNRVTIYKLFKKWGSEVVFIGKKNIVIKNSEVLVDIVNDNI